MIYTTRRVLSSTLITLVVLALSLIVGPNQSPARAESLPSGVTHRLKQIDQYMTKVEQALTQDKARRNDLERAQQALKEIKDQYSANAGASEVRAAEDRINKGVAAIEKLESDKASSKADQAAAEKNLEQTAEAWADKLAVYKADESEGSKGNYGCPLSDPKQIIALASQYKEAKTLYGEFLATGIDKDSHWKLRDAEYNIKVAIENYEGSIARLVAETASKVKEARDWLVGQKSRPEPLYMSADRLSALKEKAAGVRPLLDADSPALKAIDADMAEIEKTQSEIEKIVLKKRKMKPDVYKGADAAKVKSMAKSVVLKEDSGAKVLRIHVTSATWQTEDVVEWSDTTKTAAQHRVTKGLNVQVAIKKGSDCFLCTVFVNKSNIGGAAGSLTGHVMFKDKFLEENLPK